jgi:hypothetical protein
MHAVVFHGNTQNAKLTFTPKASSRWPYRSKQSRSFTTNIRDTTMDKGNMKRRVAHRLHTRCEIKGGIDAERDVGVSQQQGKKYNNDSSIALYSSLNC